MSNFPGDDEVSFRTSDFYIDQMFGSREELMEWVQNTARSIGFVIITKRSKTYANKFVYKVILMCDRGGEYKSKATSRVSGSKKNNCKFELEGKYSRQYDRWMIKVICDEHNHRPAQCMEGHPFARRLSDDEARLVGDLTMKNVARRDILSTLKEQNKNNVSTLKTIYNAQQKIRMTEQAGRTPMQVLMSLLHANDYVFEFTTGDSNELENLFFVHPTSWRIWRAFPHVLIIDATYKTNRYSKPFVQIVGVTSTQKTFSIAFVFMHREKEANYTWALNCLKLTLEECMHPRVIITDRELALINACKQVFPNATQLLCRWHIEQNIVKHCQPSIRSQHDWDSFKAMWKLLVQSPTWITYMENYKRLQSMLVKYPGVLKYVEQTWLHKYKEMFVSVWVDQSLNFGNRTTNRVESQHAKLKKYLDSSKSNLDKFVKTINEIVQSQLTSINESFEKSRIFRYNHHNLLCFRLLRGFVTNEALDIILGELERSNGLKLDFSNCGCQLRNSCGLPCACMLSVYSNSGGCIPLDSVDIFWRKLDLLPTTSVENDNICCDDDIEKFKETFNKQSPVGKKSFLRKLKEIFEPGTTTVKEPDVQKNTRGRPSLKKQQKKNVNSTNQAPRRCSYSTAPGRPWLDLNIEPERHSYSIDLEDVPESHNSSLMKGIPDVFHPYITGIQDVIGDGNCGFRAVAVCLGYNEDQWLYIRQQLLEELYSEYNAYCNVFTDGFNELHESLCFSEIGAPQQHWMIMPLTGYLIANKFGVIVHCLSHEQSVTCFPLWKGPQEFQHHQTITVANIYSNHYVSVFLQGDYPMPPVTAYWRAHKSPSASVWQTMYMSRFELFDQLRRRCSVTPSIHIDD